MPPTRRQTTDENERLAARLTGQRIAAVRYFLLSVTAEEVPWEWDFGVWHEPTMGVELVTEDGGTFSVIWSQYEEWGFGVDLFDGPMGAHLVGEAGESWVEVSEHPPWSSVVGKPIEVSFVWNDFGTGRPPCPEAVRIASGSTAAWIVAAGVERQEGKLSIQLGMDELMVIFDDKFLRALGLFDPLRGCDRSGELSPTS